MQRVYVTIGYIFFFFVISPLINVIQAQPLPDNSRLQPFIRYFKPSDYRAHSQNWDVAQGPEGLIYVANTKGLLQYDGYRWNKIAMPNHNIVRQVELYNDTLFVGAKGTWGYVKNDSTGSPEFISLKKKTEAAGAQVKTIWGMISTKKGLYIKSGKRLIKRSNGKLYLFPDSLKISSMTRRSNYSLFASRMDGALVVISGKTVKPIYNGKGLKHQLVKGVYPLKSGGLAIFTVKASLILKDNKISPRLTEAQDLLKNDYVLHTLQLVNENIALATTAGLIIISPSGKVLHHIDKTNGLPFNIVINIFGDREGNLWLAMNSGLAVLNASFSSNYFSGESFGGKVEDIAFYKNQLFIATTQSIYKLASSGRKFEKVLPTNLPCRALLATREGLLLGCARGLKIYTENGVKTILNHVHVFSLTPSGYNPNMIYVSSAQGIFPIRLAGGEWKAGKRIYKGQIDWVVVVGENDLLAATLMEGVLRLKIRKDSVIVKRYGKKDGLPSGRLILGKMGNLFLVSSGDSSAWFKVKKNGIEIIDDPLSALNLTDVISRDSTTAWSWNKKVFIKLMKIANGWQWEPVNTGMFHPYDIEGIFPTKDDGIWVSSGNKLVHISKSAVKRKIKPPAAPAYRSIRNLKDKRIDFNAERRTIIENNVKGFRVSFTSLPFLSPDKLTYQSRLIGFGNKWSSWSKEPFVDYGSLQPGSYKLQVRAKNKAGLRSGISSLSLYIEPFWYRTWWAWLIYSVILFALFAGIIYLLIRGYYQRSHLLGQLITERTRLTLSREKITQQTNKLRKLDQLKNQFYANISHELRTPLTLILGPVQNILNKESRELPKRIQKELEPALRSGRRLHRLVGQLLDLARMESENLKISASLNDLAEFINKIASAFESLAENEGVSLTINLTDAPCLIYYDPEQLEKVLTNLLSNAIKYTPKGGSVNVELHENDDDITIRIKDSGIGIGEGDLPHIFDRFYQADSSMTRKEGMGVGLALSRELIELHQGSLAARSRPGEGSTFDIRLLKGKSHFTDDQMDEKPEEPAEKTALDVSEAAGLKSPGNGRPKSTANGRDRKTLLVIDDNADMCRYVRDIMEENYRVMEAYNGEDGLEIAGEALPDMILCDVMMPKMDGFAFSQKLKEDPMTAAIPVIFLTGRADKQGRLEGLKAGADDYMTKPFDAELLQVRVKNMIDQRMRLRRQLQQEQPVTNPEFVQSSFEKRVRKVIQENLTDYQFGVEELAREVAVSKSHLSHKLKKETGTPASSFIRRVRLEQAAEMLKNREGNVTEIAYSVGFNSLSYFSRCFKDYFGSSPSEYLN